MGRLILENVNVLDGIHPAVQDQTVTIDREWITSVKSSTPDPRPGDQKFNLGGRTVMPGMCTCHFHSTYHHTGVGPYGNEFPPAYQALISEKNLQTALRWGYTSMVGAGGANEVEAGVKQAIEDGLIIGPRFMPSSREISTTGHSNDAVPWYWGMPRVGSVRICDGPESFRLGVREEVKRGAEVIKMFVTGGHGVMTPSNRVEMTRDEMAAAIETAHSRDVIIRGHIASKPTIMLAIELGMDIIDHCDEMDEEVIAALVETGTFVVPSIYYPKVTAAFLASTNPSSAKEITDGLQRTYDVLPKAESAGVRMLLGDDYGAPTLPHGQYGGELRSYVEDVGIAPLALIRWATRTGAELMGREDIQGTIEAGKVADLLVVDGDPSSDIGFLADVPPVAVLKNDEVVAGALAES